MTQTLPTDPLCVRLDQILANIAAACNGLVTAHRLACSLVWLPNNKLQGKKETDLDLANCNMTAVAGSQVGSARRVAILSETNQQLHGMAYLRWLSRQFLRARQARLEATDES